MVSVDDFRKGNTQESDLITKCREVIDDVQSDYYVRKSIEHDVELGEKYALSNGLGKLFNFKRIYYI